MLICDCGIGPGLEGLVRRRHDVEAAAALGSSVRPSNIRGGLCDGRIKGQAWLELRHLRWNRDQ